MRGWVWVGGWFVGAHLSTLQRVFPSQQAEPLGPVFEARCIASSIRNRKNEATVRSNAGGGLTSVTIADRLLVMHQHTGNAKEEDTSILLVVVNLQPHLQVFAVDERAQREVRLRRCAGQAPSPANSSTGH